MPRMRRKDRELRDRESQAAIFDKADVCRLAFAAGNVPYIVTMNFGYEWEGSLPVLFFHCARDGRKLDMMRANPRVCFELDVGHELATGPGPCDCGMRYASIVGYGSLGELGDEGERLEALSRIMRHYGWRGEGDFDPAALGATTLLRLSVEEMSGKRKA